MGSLTESRSFSIFKHFNVIISYLSKPKETQYSSRLCNLSWNVESFHNSSDVSHYFFQGHLYFPEYFKSKIKILIFSNSCFWHLTFKVQAFCFLFLSPPCSLHLFFLWMYEPTYACFPYPISFNTDLHALHPSLSLQLKICLLSELFLF